MAGAVPDDPHVGVYDVQPGAVRLSIWSTMAWRSAAVRNWPAENDIPNVTAASYSASTNPSATCTAAPDAWDFTTPLTERVTVKVCVYAPSDPARALTA